MLNPQRLIILLRLRYVGCLLNNRHCHAQENELPLDIPSSRWTIASIVDREYLNGSHERLIPTFLCPEIADEAIRCSSVNV